MAETPFPFLGTVPGSNPLAPEVVPEGRLPMPLEVSKHPQAFALRVIGDSMSPKIEDGDLVFVEPVDGTTPRSGTIVIAIIAGETICRIFKHTSGGLPMLVPLNPVCEPIYPDSEECILGIVVGSYRHFKTQ